MATYIPSNIRTYWFETGWFVKAQCWASRVKVNLDPIKELHQELLPVCPEDCEDSGHWQLRHDTYIPLHAFLFTNIDLIRYITDWLLMPMLNTSSLPYFMSHNNKKNSSLSLWNSPNPPHQSINCIPFCFLTEMPPLHRVIGSEFSEYPVKMNIYPSPQFKHVTPYGEKEIKWLASGRVPTQHYVVLTVIYHCINLSAMIWY